MTIINKMIYYPGEKKYNKWLNLAQTVIDYSDNVYNIDKYYLLHDFLLKITKYNNFDEKKYNNTGYIFTSLRNMYRDIIREEKKREMKSIDIEDYYNDVIVDDDEYDENIDLKNVEKIEHIDEVVGDMNIFDKQLFDLHYIAGISQRQIARKIDISHITINKKVKKISNSIIIEFDKKNKRKKYITNTSLKSIMSRSEVRMLVNNDKGKIRTIINEYNKLYNSNLKYCENIDVIMKIIERII